MVWGNLPVYSKHLDIQEISLKAHQLFCWARGLRLNSDLLFLLLCYSFFQYTSHVA